MANAHNPTRFNGEADNFFDLNMSVDINSIMKVPKSISVSADYKDEHISGINGSAWNVMSEKFDMYVPDRILLAGQEQLIGTKAPPIEIAMENSIWPAEPPIVRCVTPPRILTLDTHYFPSVDEDLREKDPVDIEPAAKREIDVLPRNIREQTPAYGILDSSIVPGEEVTHLRRQVGKLNRRVMAIESEMQQQQQRMKLIYIVTAMYICFKTMFWFGKN